jgi:methylenetetrahydrofolate--tRNA-(uracil-5-)-methyltransferase
MTPAHKTGDFAELVCSNSLKSEDIETSSGLLKAELRLFDSLILSCADKAKVPAGSALSVERRGFSAAVKDALTGFGGLTITEREVKDIAEVFPLDGEILIIAAGPLISDALAKSLAGLTGGDFLYFFDAAAPIVSAESIDYGRAFFASRYGKGDASDYLNCPLDKDEYARFYTALISAECAPVRGFESQVFSGCMPVEVMARGGGDALRFGPMKPVGIYDADGKRPYAVVQLRKENAAATMYNLVGFQTHLTFGEQRRVFSMIPALREAEFLRYGVMHRNSFINAPAVLDETFSFKDKSGGRGRIFVAGQLSGVEGYVESAMSGLIAAENALRVLQNKPYFRIPDTTMTGALCRYISGGDPKGFQPMNSNFGLLPPLAENIKDKKKRKAAYAERALSDLRDCLDGR